jgi:hypothetical protein
MSGGGGDIFGYVDESSLNEELKSRNKNHNPDNPHPFSIYVHRVIGLSGVPDAQETREMASHICGVVARLPFLPDDKATVATKTVDGKEFKVTEFDQQVEKTAKRAEEALDSEMVWTASALKLAQAAMDLRREDPTGALGKSSKGREGAWVNDPLPGERRLEAVA